MTLRRVLPIGAIFMVGLVVGTTIVQASHSWRCRGSVAYHWSTTSVGLANPVQDGSIQRASSAYTSAYSGAKNVWNATVMNLGSGNDVEQRYGAYGTNGWLGLATISNISNCVIGHGKAQLNDSYLRDTTRYSQTAVDHVACQEVGHTFGLDHTRASGTCMNDRILTAGNQINQHDHDQLASIYGQ